jgi:hypothetical protein
MRRLDERASCRVTVRLSDEQRRGAPRDPCSLNRLRAGVRGLVSGAGATELNMSSRSPLPASLAIEL